MKLEMELRPKDITLLKILACVLAAFLMIRFLIFPGVEKHMDLSEQKEEISAQQQDMEALISRKDSLDGIIANQQSALRSAQEGYYDLLENREVDTLITGIILNHRLFPVYLSISESSDGVPAPYVLAAQTVSDATASDTTDTDSSSADNSTDTSDSSDTENSSEEAAASQVVTSYVHSTSVDVTIQGSETQIRAFLDDIANNYPGIQVSSFDMQEDRYVNDSLQTVSEITCSCTLTVYTCGENE